MTQKCRVEAINGNNATTTTASLGNRWRSLECQAGTSKLILDDGVKVLRHLRRHIVHPISSHPFPEEGFMGEIENLPIVGAYLVGA